MTVNGSGRAAASSGFSQKLGFAMWRVWWLSSVTRTVSIRSACFSRNAAVRFVSSSAPGTASDPPSWKSFCGSMITRQTSPPAMPSPPTSVAARVAAIVFGAAFFAVSRLF